MFENKFISGWEFSNYILADNNYARSVDPYKTDAERANSYDYENLKNKQA